MGERIWRVTSRISDQRGRIPHYGLTTTADLHPSLSHSRPPPPQRATSLSARDTNPSSRICPTAHSVRMASTPSPKTTATTTSISTTPTTTTTAETETATFPPPPCNPPRKKPPASTYPASSTRNPRTPTPSAHPRQPPAHPPSHQASPPPPTTPTRGN